MRMTGAVSSAEQAATHTVPPPAFEKARAVPYTGAAMDSDDRLFGEIAVRLRLLTREQVATCIHAQAADAASKRIGEIALGLGILSREHVALVLSHQARVLERRREATKGVRPPGAIVEDHAVRNDRRADLTVPVGSATPQPTPAAPAPEKPEPKAAPAPSVKARGNSMQLGATLAAMPAPVLSAPLPPNPAPSLSLAETRPDPRPDSYDFGTPAKPAAPTAVAAPAPPRAPANATLSAGAAPPARPAVFNATLLQPSGAVMRQPLDRSWRNPSRPPPAPASPPATRIPLVLDDPGIRIRSNTGTVAGLPAPQVSPNGAAPAPRELHYLDHLLVKAREAGASDLHVHAGAPILVRVDGKLAPLSADTPLAAAGADRVISELMTDTQWDALATHGELCFAYESPSSGRFRARVYRHERGLSAVFRVIPRTAPSLEDLALPTRLQKLVDLPKGLVLCAGAAGSGKSSTLSALLRYLAEQRAAYIVTIEQPIELVLPSARAVIVQCEVPTHVQSVAHGVELALQQGATVLGIDELRDAQSVLAALEAVAAGALVLTTLRSPSSSAALAHVLGLLDRAAPEDRATHCAMLARSLSLVTQQQLLPQAIGVGRVAALEILPVGTQVAELIESDALERLGPLLESGKAVGITGRRDAQRELVATGVVTAEALLAAQHGH